MNSRQRRMLRRLSERMFKLCDLTRLRIAQDLDKFCAICAETARKESEPPFPRKRKQQQFITGEDGIE